ILTFQNHTNRPLTDFGGKTSIFSHPVYLFLREFSLQDFRGGSVVIVWCQCHQLTGRLIHLAEQFFDV
ncbi:hypothetical protein HNS17_27885, partial [Escherichia coli]|nr:hypothetical protein [Escherichia coli]MCR2898813.1 hypothetical protein [Escherichia coli]